LARNERKKNVEIISVLHAVSRKKLSAYYTANEGPVLPNVNKIRISSLPRPTLML